MQVEFFVERMNIVQRYDDVAIPRVGELVYLNGSEFVVISVIHYPDRNEVSLPPAEARGLSPLTTIQSKDL